MGWDQDTFNQMLQRIAVLEQQVKDLQGNRPAQVAVAREFEQTVPVQVIGDQIQVAYDVINTQVEQLRQSNDPNASEKITELVNLKASVPYHFSFGQKDQVWINDQINAILNKYP